MSRGGSTIRQDEEFRQIAHDARNHLVAVMKSLEMLHKGEAGPITKPQAEVLGAAHECAEMVLDMTTDILERSEVGRARTHVQTRFDLIEVLGWTVRLARGLAIEKDVSIGFDPDSAAESIRADRGQVARVILNVLMNAIEFSPAGSRVLITSRKDTADAVVVGVRDDGPGIPLEHQRRVFRRRYNATTPGSRPHHGLGLYLCRRTIEAHGGQIWIESPPAGRDFGTEVLFTLPRDGRRMES